MISLMIVLMQAAWYGNFRSPQCPLAFRSQFILTGRQLKISHKVIETQTVVDMNIKACVVSCIEL
jgi:hypothetical protein